MGGNSMKLHILQIIFLCIIFIPVANAVEYPSPTGYVNDFANMLSPGDVVRLNNELIAIEKNTTVEIAIVTVDSLQGVSVEEYAVKLFEKWGIGKKGKDNGLLILVSKNDREYRIETGYGLEGTINAARAGRIGRDILEPNFKRGEYGTGLYEAVLEVKGLVSNNPDVVSKYTTQDNNEFIAFTGVNPSLILVIMGIILFKIYKKKDEKKAKILMLGCNALAIVAIYFVAGFNFAYIAFFILIFLYLFITDGFDKGSSGEGWSGRSGSHGGGGFGGGSGGGGFGGGSSGGGGHSGKW
jgi:uncharacterized protein